MEPLFSKEKTCCFTGHRPERFPWNGSDNDIKQIALIAALKKETEYAISKGYRHFITGNALGVDTWAAQVVLEMKKEYPDVTLEVAIPYEGHNKNVCEEDRRIISAIHSKADLKTVVSNEKSINKAYAVRDRYMVDKSSLLIAVYDERSGLHGGTERTVEYAKQKGICIDLIGWMDL